MGAKKQEKKLVLFRIFLMIAFVVIGFIPYEHVFAASATVGFEPSEPNLVVGDQFTIALTVDTDTYLGDFEGNISYDSSVIEYLSGPSCVAGGDGMLRIEDVNASSSFQTRSYVLTFEAIGTGDCELSLIGAPVAYDYENQDPMSVSSTTKTIHISAPKTASTNADLASMKISPSSLTPSFDSSISEYSTIVDATTTRLVISAIAQDSNATVEIVGNQDFIVGSNYVKVIVVAESGAKHEYTIHVVKEELDFIPIDPDEGTQGELYGIHASIQDGVTLLNGSYSYTVVISEEGITIPEGYVKTSIKLDGYTVPVYQFDGNIEDDYLLMILQNQFGQTNLYRYDRYEKTLQRYTGDRVIVQEYDTDQELELNKQKNRYEEQLGNRNLLVVILTAVNIILLIGLISLFIKTKLKQEDDL